MPKENLPKTYKGYSTDDLLAMSVRMQKTGSLKGETRDKILAMRMLENEYRLVPELQPATK